MSVVPAASVAAAYRSDPGRVRGNNEDLAVCDPAAGILGVIDGVGGQTAGEVAAAVAQRVLHERLARPLGTPADRVREAIALANNVIRTLADGHPEYEGMTCVMTLAVLHEQRLTIGHVGDSRCYKVTPAGLRKLTHDHSPVGEREDAGELTEEQAMRHPRRNEVFRDVGGEHRDKDDEGFIEIVEDTLEPDAAVLLCTDGLTDMIDTAAVARLIQTHAGNPQDVADALVTAANSAGGKDNVTVVYGEGPAFAAAIRKADAAPATAAPAARVARGRAGRTLRWIARQPATWLAAGILIGVGAALALVARLDGDPVVPGASTLIVGTSAPFARISDALSVAHAGDVVQVEPGSYAERLSVPDGVDLVARVPGSVILRRDEAVEGEWVAVTAAGPGTVTGFRIESTPQSPVTVGVRVSGADRHLQWCEVDGPVRTGIEVVDGRNVTIESATIHPSRGPGVTIVGGSDIRIARSTLVRGGPAGEPALLLKDTVRLTLWQNVFGGYGPDLIRGVGAGERDALLGRAHSVLF